MKRILYGFPLLFAVAPVLFLYSHNIDIVIPSYITRPIIGTSLGSLMLFFCLRLFIKQIDKAVIITALWTIGFYSYGHIFQLVPRVERGGLAVDLYYPFFAVFIICYAGITALIISTQRSLRTVIIYLTVVGLFLVCFPLFTITRNVIQTNGNKIVAPFEAATSTTGTQNKKPDIYYIILDGYARADVLRNIYQYDNSDFIDYLQQNGFFVAEKSTANYPQTFYSIASSLNYEYLDSAQPNSHASPDDRNALRNMIEKSKTHELLKNLGYKFVTFPSGWVGLSRHLPADIRMHEAATVSEFESILIATTPISRIFDRTIRTKQHRQEVLYALDHLPDLAANPAPTFSYVHIMSPHPPFVFASDGGVPVMRGGLFAYDGSHYFKHYPDKNLYRQQYRDQLSYLNGLVKQAITKILANSPEPPVIILQSDHGPGSMLEWEDPTATNMVERFSNLNAYYVPADTRSMLYQSITPVNSFRAVFSSVFGADLDRIPDYNYFNTWSDPWVFIDVSKKAQPPETGELTS